jgi:hypothetical protein
MAFFTTLPLFGSSKVWREEISKGCRKINIEWKYKKIKAPKILYSKWN